MNTQTFLRRDKAAEYLQANWGFGAVDTLATRPRRAAADPASASLAASPSIPKPTLTIGRGRACRTPGSSTSELPAQPHRLNSILDGVSCHLKTFPDEMKRYDQWVVWKYEYDEAEDRTTKIPLNPSAGYKASHSKPSDSGTFDQAIDAFRNGNCDGIGFVFSDDDPYAGIDLDDTNGDEWLQGKHQGIFNAFESYAELSPSGNGLHIIVKGAVPSGRNSRRHKAEVYSSHRFFTMTGNRYRDAPIADCNDLLNQLWVDIRPTPTRAPTST